MRLKLVSLCLLMLAAGHALAGVPDWARDAIVYEALVDRFCDGNPANNHSGEGPLPPSQNPGYHPAVNFLGGDLAGVRKQLPYLADLGVNCLWLTPVFRTPFYHGYHVMDYDQIEPHFGDEAELKRLVDEAHSLGIRVLLDYVANHASEYHVAFQDALKDQGSRFHDWFLWKSWPREYERFYYFPDLPRWNLGNGQVRDMLMGSAAAWVRKLGIDGYRLDFAAGPGKDFWREFSSRIGADKFLIGEVWEDAPTSGSGGDVLHGCMDFPRQAVFKQFFAQGSIDVDSFDRSMNDLRHIYGSMAMGSFLGNHDLPRFLGLAGNDAWKLYLAAIAQLTFDEVPILYYGNEVIDRTAAATGAAGASGKVNEEASDQETRRMMPWGDSQDRELHDLFRTLIHLRRELSPLRRGSTTTVWRHNDLGQYAILRAVGDEQVLVVLNNKSDASEAPVPARDGAWRDVLGNRVLTAAGGTLKVRLPGHWGAILIPESDRARALGAKSAIPTAARKALQYSKLGD
ncbi:MAG: alpha-glucosidase C-terminal domain-containing protein [Candidatus Wallbacteria bacterium]|nr:alpha-glucosidase C-terminal domain-containing protein [Candidatus Wallbacteria bacterium]